MLVYGFLDLHGTISDYSSRYSLWIHLCRAIYKLGFVRNELQMGFMQTFLASHCCLYMSRIMTKPTKWVCAQRRLRSAWASTQSDQSHLAKGRESLFHLYLYLAYVTYGFFSVFLFSSSCQGLTADCDYGTPWIFMHPPPTSKKLRGILLSGCTCIRAYVRPFVMLCDACHIIKGDVCTFHFTVMTSSMLFEIIFRNKESEFKFDFVAFPFP